MLHRALALLATCLLTAATAAAEDMVDGIAAQVGSDIVLYSEVMEAAAPRQTSPGRKSPRPRRSTS